MVSSVGQTGGTTVAQKMFQTAFVTLLGSGTKTTLETQTKKNK
jgi:hypothetical protein